MAKDSIIFIDVYCIYQPMQSPTDNTFS